VRNVDNHAQLLHLSDYSSAKVSQTTMAFIVVTVDPTGSGAPSERDRTNSKSIERTQYAQVFVDASPTLDRDQYGYLAFGFRLHNVIGI
jgi:hypothetical protein